MIIPRIDNEIFVVGLSEGPVTSGVVKALSSQDASVRVYLPEEAAQYLAAFAAHHYPLPLVVEQGYDMNSIRVLLVTALQHGVRLVPVGSQTLWEQMVPLEMPELIDLRVIAPDELKVQEEVQAPEPEEEKETPLDTSCETYVVNGTTVCTRFPSLRHRLADLGNAGVIADEPCTQDSVPMNRPLSQQPGRPYKSKHLIEKILLTAVLLVCVMGIAFYLICLSSGNLDSHQVQSAPAVLASPAKVDAVITVAPKPDVCQNAKDIEGIKKCAEQGCEDCKKKVEHYAEAHAAEDSAPTDEQLKAGTGMGCHRCKLHIHKNKAHKEAQVSAEDYKAGLKLECEECRKIEHGNKYHKDNPEEITAAVRTDGVKLGCKDCLAAEHQKKHDNNVKVGTLSDEVIGEGVGVDCSRCKDMVMHNQEHADLLNKKPEERDKIIKAGKEYGCPRCGEFNKELLKHFDKCHPVAGGDVLTEEDVLQGEKLGCDACKIQAVLLKHKCPTEGKDVDGFKAGAAIGCPKCSAVVEAQQKVEEAREELKRATGAKNAADEAVKQAKDKKDKAEKDHAVAVQSANDSPQNQDAQKEAENKAGAVEASAAALAEAEKKAADAETDVAKAKEALDAAENALEAAKKKVKPASKGNKQK